MKSYKEFYQLDERAGGPASPVGKSRLLKQKEQNLKNLEKKAQSQNKPGALVKVPGKEKVEKEAVGTVNSGNSRVKPQPGNPRSTPSPTPGVSGTTTTTTARLGQGGSLATDAQAKKWEKKRQKKVEKQAKKENKDKNKAAQEKFDKSRRGFGAGIKKALGGDIIGSRKTGDKTYDKFTQKDKEEKRRDFAQKKVTQAGNVTKSGVNKAGDLWNKARANNTVGVSYGTPIA